MTVVSNRRAGSEPGPGPAPELLGFDHVEWWVGNARHSAQFFTSGFGFAVEAYAGPETGQRDRVSYALRQGEIRFVVTSALDGTSEIADHVRRHGDGVRVVAYRVADAREAHARAVARGGVSAQEPREYRDEHGAVVIGAIRTYGDTVHNLVERDDYHGAFLPGFEPAAQPASVGALVGLTRFDHVVANVEDGRLAEWVAWYDRVWGLGQLQHFGEEAISTEFSALRSTVVWNGGQVVQPINEPADGLRKSQIAEYLDYYGSPGVQHLALRTDDIVATVAALRERGIRLLHVPRRLLRGSAGAHGRPRRRAALGAARRAGDPRRPRRARLPVAGVHRIGGEPPDRVPRDHPARGRARVRRGELQGAVRVDRSRAGAAREPLIA